nr:helicase-related protein [Synechococcus elongatus]AZB72446.1 hypothetical protein DOP62_06675 [Synechococcus elongatus PCC 11801]
MRATRDARDVLNNLVKTLKYLEASEELPTDDLRYEAEPNLASYHEAIEWLGEGHPLTQALHYRVGLHYGPLPDPVRQAIEEEFRDNRLRILVSTNTLGQGVNLPVKTVIIHSLERRWSESTNDGEPVIYSNSLRKRDFWNICGRAGRAGKETEGQVVFVKITSHDEELIREYQNQGNLEEVDSGLFKILQALVERRISQNDLIGYLDSHLLALLAEEAVDTQDEANISSFLDTSLVGVQANRKQVEKTPLASAMRTASAWILDQVEDEGLRKVFAATGLRVSSCQAIEANINQYFEEIRSELENIENVEYVENTRFRNSDFFIQVAFIACQSLPEMRLLHTIDYHGPEGDEFSLIRSWVNGAPIRELRNNLWDPDKEEDFSRYLADRITYKLPWGINGFLSILAFKLGREYTDLPVIWQHLPSMVKFGVNSIFSCWASSLGITSRNSALQIGQAYLSENPFQTLDYSDFVRWFVNLPNDYIFSEISVSNFEYSSMFKIRNGIVFGNESLQCLREEIQEIESPVREISYVDSRVTVAAKVREGDVLELNLEPDNPYDPTAVSVSFDGEQIGYVQRDKAIIISRELQLGKQVTARATRVRFIDDQANQDPLIDMQIMIE